MHLAYSVELGDLADHAVRPSFFLNLYAWGCRMASGIFLNDCIPRVLMFVLFLCVFESFFSVFLNSSTPLCF